jgi:hypothetical protein
LDEIAAAFELCLSRFRWHRRHGRFGFRGPLLATECEAGAYQPDDGAKTAMANS